jgi:hypothetical protein
MVVGEAEGADCRQAEEAKTRKTRRRTDCKRGKQRKRHRIHRTPLVYILPPLLQPPRKINAILARLLQTHSWAIFQLLPCRSMTQLPKSLLNPGGDCPICLQHFAFPFLHLREAMRIPAPYSHSTFGNGALASFQQMDVGASGIDRECDTSLVRL